MAFRELHDKAFALFEAMISENPVSIEESLRTFLDKREEMTPYKISPVLSDGTEYNIGYHFLVNDENIANILNIGKFLNVECAPILEVIGRDKKQKMITYTLGAVLRKCFDENYHTMTSKGVVHRNKYHNDSLGTHCIDVMLRNISLSTKDDIFVDGLIGLIHDLGKTVCWKAIGIPTPDPKSFIKTVGFPFHGEMGQMILTRLYGENYAKYFSLEQWESIVCDVVGKHMCGYRCPCKSTAELEEDSMWSYKLNLFRLSSPDARKHLHRLSTADAVGAYPDADCLIDLKDYGKSRRFIFDEFQKVFDPDQLNKDRMARGLVVSLFGCSAEGKTTMAMGIIDHLEKKGIARNRCHVLSRDDFVMIHVIEVLRRMQANGRLPHGVPNPDIVDLERISLIDGEDYKKFYDFYKTKRRWNTRDPNSGMASRVNKNMRMAIKRYLTDGDVILVDTLALLFKMDSKNSIFPPEVANAYKFNVFVNREEMITDEDCYRHGMDMKTQLKLFAVSDRTLWNPFPKGFLTPGITNDCFKDIRTFATRHNERMLSDLERNFRMPDRTHFISWRKDYSVGKNLLLKDLDLFVPVLLSRKFLPTSELNKMNLLDVVQYLDDTYGFEQMRLFFVSKHFRVNTQFDGKIILFTYHNGNMVWQPKWAKQTRGTGFYKKNDGSWYCFKNPMPRGAEVATKEHDDEHIETQEMQNSHDIDQLDKDQAESYYMLNDKIPVPTGQEVFGFLDSKKDGSLLMANWIPKICEIHDELRDLILSKCDRFAMTVINVCDRLSLPGFFMLCTQNTIMIPEVMKDYTITALTEEYDRATIGRAKLEGISVQQAIKKKFDSYGGSQSRMLEDVLPTFFLNCVAGLRTYDLDHISCLSFESIIADRTTYLEEKHYELACSYKNGGLSFLGATVHVGPGQGKYIPHFFLTPLVIAAGFKEPRYWKIKNPKEIMTMLHSMTEMLKVGDSMSFQRQYTKFFEDFPPDNPITGTGNLDFEGFILFRLLDNLDDPTMSYSFSNSNVNVVYSKVKTIWYYHCHGHLTPEKIPMLLALTEDADSFFPILARIRNYFIDLPGSINLFIDAVLTKMKEVCDRDPPAEGEVLKFYDDIDDRGKTGFYRRSIDGRYATLLNNSTSFKSILADEFFRVFPGLKTGFDPTNTNDVNNTLRDMFNRLRPWKEDWEDKIVEMTNVSTLHPSMTKLFYLTGLNYNKFA